MNSQQLHSQPESQRATWLASRHAADEIRSEPSAAGDYQIPVEEEVGR
jgi:hypothetical protein